MRARPAQVAQQVGQYAEHYRREKALHWLGREMPPWSEPCPLHVKVTFGGANLNFFPMGAWAKRTGTIFIRRQTKDIPVYRFVLRAYAAQLVQNHANLTWSIEGGRTRTGKLRPPRYGLLRYVVDAVQSFDGPEVLLVPSGLQ